MRKIASSVFQLLAFLVVMDLMVLTFSLGQIALENRTGEWNSFWSKQAEILINVLN